MRNGTKYRNGLAQLQLLPGATTEPDWRVDEHTRDVGRHGIAQAREILRRTAARESGPDHSNNANSPTRPSAEERTSV
jgi:hypothetical protein